MRVNNGGVCFWLGRAHVEGVGVAVGIAVEITVSVRADVAIACRVGEGKVGIGFRFRISRPLVKLGSITTHTAIAVWVAVALVIGKVAIAPSADARATFNVCLSLLDLRSANKCCRHYRLFNINDEVSN